MFFFSPPFLFLLKWNTFTYVTHQWIKTSLIDENTIYSLQPHILRLCKAFPEHFSTRSYQIEMVVYFIRNIELGVALYFAHSLESRSLTLYSKLC